MIAHLELRRAEMSLMRVKVARQELELSILERQADIERMQESVEKQLQAEAALEKQVAELKEKTKNG